VGGDMKRFMVIVCLCLFWTVWASGQERTSGRVLADRVVAFVDSQAITLSELNDRYETMRRSLPDITRAEVLGTMVNRLLIRNDARRMRIIGADEEDILRQYIDVNVRSGIVIRYDEVERFYKDNEKDFPGVGLEGARQQIEKYLRERQVNERLKELSERLRRDAFVRIQLDDKNADGR
jgi:hypothetical protein